MAAMKISALPVGAVGVVSADSKPVVPMSLPTAMESSESWGSGCTSQALHGRDYGNLFNLEPLLSYQIPIDDNFPSCPDVSIDEMKDEVRLLDYMSSEKAERPLSSQSEMTLKRKRIQIEAEAGSNACHRDGDEYNDDIEDIQISEEQYRCLLGEHLDKRRKAYLKDAIASRLTAKQPFYEAKHASCLDLGGGLIFQIPPFYDELAASLNLPDSASIEIDESILSGQLNSSDLMTVISSDPRARIWGLGELGSGFASKSYEQQKQGVSGDMYPLQVFDAASVEPVLSPMHEDDAEVMQEVHFENKILERGDGYEVIQRRIPKRDSIRRNPDTMAREDGEKISKCWSNLVRKDLPRHFKHFMTYQKKQKEMKKFADFCQREVKSRNMRLVKMMKAAALRTRKQLSRDMVIFWKRIDKEQAEIKKREEKDAADALKREEEMREARRQQQRLNFLLTQTELYSHFMQNKQASQNKSALQAGSEQSTVLLDSNAPLDAIEAAELEALKEQALQAAKMAASEQQDIINMFDEECLRLRQDDGPTEDPGNDIDLLNPSTMPTSSSVQQPRLFHGILKEYQLKGLQWLVNCYEQGLNGILADEMGLGKTIQAMAFLAHLAEDKNIWGPFLVVAPASVLSNWADEVNRFCPQLKILPYWGGLQERAVLRKNINPKRLYRREASFHILITSYQLLVSDEKYFKRVKWQYMVLDEAQAIKSANSVRWKTLLSFNCRNRLLLTGTPIQNNMAELWALLHFIMPTLFDSHEQFNEWFSKGIESHAEHGGTLNEHQLTRLHAILKPFMLRRVKKDVITELSNKTEVVVPCFLSSRQEAIYQAIKNKISLSDLFDGSHMNDLMNIVIQLRKVCNHPELFERNEGHAFFHFAQFSNSLLPPPFGELEDIHFAGSHNPITCKIPRLVYRNGMQCLPTWCSGSPQGFQEKWLGNLLNVYSSHNVYDSVFPSHDGFGIDNGVSSGTFGFTRLLGLSPSEVAYMAKSSNLERWLFDLEQSERASINTMTQLFTDEIGEEKTRAVTRLLVSSKSASSILSEKLPAGLPCAPFEALITTVQEKFLASIRILRAVYAFIPPVSAPQIEVVCSDRSFAYQRLEELHNPWVKKMLVGFSRTSEYNGPSIPPTCDMVEERSRKVQQPLLAIPFRVFGSALPLQSFDFAKTLTDSGKLQALDRLLRRLRAENHRVLVFAQMTKMLDILEDYMNYRKYRYLRLDGSSTIMDRRDMVKDFQHRSDIFVFLLSTRAGGLGINLTAADTVIFYESDWNPTMDLQAMDRAHRLGQTKEVTVYRLICKGTVEEKIVKRANQKNTVQQLVMTGNQSQDVFEADEVVSLLLDDAELEQKLKRQSTDQQSKRKKGWGMSGGLKAIQMDAEGGLCITEIPNDVNGGFVEGELQPGTGKAAAVENGGSKRKVSRKRQSTEGRPPKPTKANKMAKEKNAPRESQKHVLKDVQPKKEIASRTPRKRGKGKNDTTLNGTLDTSNGS